MAELYSFEQAMDKIGCKKDWRRAVVLCKEHGFLDDKRFPLPPYKYLKLFEVKKVRVPAGFDVHQPFLTEKMVNILWGMVIVDARYKKQNKEKKHGT